MASAMTGQTSSLKRRDTTAATAGPREGDQLIVTPLGAGSEVGRSCVYMSYRGKIVLVKRRHLFCVRSISFIFYCLDTRWGMSLPCMRLYRCCIKLLAWFRMAVWLWDSSGLLWDGCTALFRRDWSLDYWCASRHTVCGHSIFLFLPFFYCILGILQLLTC